MRLNEEYAIDLEPHEVMPLITWLAARHLRHDDSWLLWENLPNLSEGSFERLCAAVEDAAGLLDSVGGWVDSAYLFDQANAQELSASDATPNGRTEGASS